jgi:hypothetical protein
VHARHVHEQATPRPTKSPTASGATGPCSQEGHVPAQRAA